MNYIAALKINPFSLQKHIFILILIIFTSSETNVFAQTTNANIVRSLNSRQSAFKTEYCKYSANSVTYINLAAPVSIFTAGLINKDKKLQKDAAYITGAFLLSSAITRTSKHLFKAQRPFEKYPAITKLSSGGGYSFPSGHTAAAFTSATSLCLYYPKWYIIAPAGIWASSVGVSRIYQGVHYPKDVFAGALVGAGSAFLSYRVQKAMDKKYKNSQRITPNEN